MGARLRLKDDEVGIIEQYRAIKDEANEMGIDPHDINHGWMKSDKASFHFKNPFFVEPDFNPDNINWKDILKDVKPLKIIRNDTKESIGHFDRLVITDHHIGMTTNQDGYSLYGGMWDAKELQLRMTEIATHCATYKQSSVLYIDELGDLMDGWDAKTCRREHDLPQNMDNQGAFDVALKYKKVLTELLLAHYDKIVWHNVCKDNHAGAFGYVVNSAFKELMSAMYTEKVIVTNQRKFIDHYTVADNTFILSHGKDDKNLKFGFPVHLVGGAGARAIAKINDYIDHNYLLKKNGHIEFSKGDSHQQLFDECSSDRFYYYNYTSFSPSSEWVQTNFKKGRSGFTLFNYMDKKRPEFYIASSIKFNWKEK